MKFSVEIPQTSSASWKSDRPTNLDLLAPLAKQGLRVLPQEKLDRREIRDHRGIREEQVQQVKLDIRVPPGLRVKQEPLEQQAKQVVWVLQATQVVRVRPAQRGLLAALALWAAPEGLDLLERLEKLVVQAKRAKQERQAKQALQE